MGDAGNDTLHGGGAADTLFGGAGDDTLRGFGGNDSLFGEAGDDTLEDGAGNDIVDGGTGADTADQGAAANGADFVGLGADAGDTVDYSGRANAVSLSRDDFVFDADDGEGCANNQVLATCEGDDAWGFQIFMTGPGNDELISESGGATFDNETFVPGAGDDVVDGELDTDTVDYSTAPAAVTIDLEAGPPGTATGGAGNDMLTSIENANGSPFDDLFLDGNMTDNDWVGGDGIDTYDASRATTNVDIDLGGFDSGDDFPGPDGSGGSTDEDVENAIGGSGNDDIQGNDLANDLTGNAGNDFLEASDGRDTLDGGEGNDDLDGNDGNDTIVGGPGDDSIDGGDGFDTTDYRAAPAGVTLDLTGGFASGDGDDEVFKVERVLGSDFNDNFRGTSLNETFQTRKGNDSVRSAGGDDTVKSGGGRDNVAGGSGDDLIRGGAGGDNLRGGGGDDDLFGQGGRDSMFGGGGTDFCNGGPGKDTARGCEIRRKL